ncbi:MAG: hypothetical protein IJV76_11080 [Clostridia bacterium]|nr:hypothetical protein [Clostridia bacterium]
MREIFLRIHPAPAHEGIGNADSRRTAEPCPDAVDIILFQKGIRNDADNFPMMVNPVFLGKMGSHILDLVTQVRVFSNVKALSQRSGYDIRVFRVHLPQIHRTGVFTAACVRYVENITNFRRIGGGINQCNPLTAASDITAHGFVPYIKRRTGGGIGTLCVDHELFMIGILVQPCCDCQKGRPVGIAAGDLPGGGIG